MHGTLKNFDGVILAKSVEYFTNYDQLNTQRYSVILIMDIKKTILRKGWFVDPQGFEPQLMVPKTRVLPLHHGSLYFSGANVSIFSLLTKKY
jgi:hypothetical protein